ncbi:TlpA disulfide reductase family protein [Frigidibacter sp. MR17.14]|uniref:TlpA disulfide reductase family protein n=1 Tax=Frigidibacter sp. MR17.14 TaxID=3126509 RepID=UPI0030130246
MARIRSAVLYTALAFGASLAVGWALARPAAAADLAPLMQGDMRKLVLSEPGQPLDATLYDPAEAEKPLSDWRGKVVLLNFWATWCAPCRKEMPSLQALQAELGGEDFAVLTIATGRNPVPAIDRFFDEVGITDLPKLRDPKQAFAREMGVLGLPVTVLLDREGREVARLTGDAAWDGPEAKALIATLIAD